MATLRVLWTVAKHGRRFNDNDDSVASRPPVHEVLYEMIGFSPFFPQNLDKTLGAALRLRLSDAACRHLLVRHVQCSVNALR